MCVCERYFARLLEYCFRQFVYPAAGHNAKARSTLQALEGLAGNTLQPTPCSPDSSFICHWGVWSFFPRDAEAACWPAEGKRRLGLQALAEGLPVHPALHRGLLHQQPGNPGTQRNAGAGSFAPIRHWKYGGAV